VSLMKLRLKLFYSLNEARFHRAGKNGTINQSQALTGRSARCETLRCATRCHPVGVDPLLVVRVPRALPWAVEYDPLGVGDGGAVASFVPVVAPADSVDNVRRVMFRAELRVVIDVICDAALWPSRRVATFSPNGAREPQWLGTKFTSRRKGEAMKGG